MRCERPFDNKGIPCPCGKCGPCRQRHASGWGFRIMKEAEQMGSAFFITLTYAQAPKSYLVKVDGKPHHTVLTKRLTVDIYHLQKFIKRVRKSQPGVKIKYYGTSEYGDETFRPHYHIIILGMDLLRFVGVDQWNKIQRGVLKLDGKDHFYVDTWKNDKGYIGNVTIGYLTMASANYTLKYISKGRKIPQYKGDDRQPEKSIMSKGMGLSYITPAIYKLHRQDLERQYCVTDEGQKIPLPRYLKDRLYDSLEREWIVEYYKQKEFEERDLMDEIALKKHYQKLRKRIDDSGKKNSYGHKGKI